MPASTRASFESGESVAKWARISRVGNRHVRAALHMPALVASRYEPHVNALYDMLIVRGKNPKAGAGGRHAQGAALDLRHAPTCAISRGRSSSPCLRRLDLEESL